MNKHREILYLYSTVRTLIFISKEFLENIHFNVAEKMYLLRIIKIMFFGGISFQLFKNNKNVFQNFSC